MAQLLSTLDVVRVVSGELRRVGHGALPCIAGERWQWTGAVRIPASGTPGTRFPAMMRPGKGGSATRRQRPAYR